jgi:hypothetical protein
MKFIWLAGFVGLIAFIVFAFRQGMKVKPDPDQRDNWPASTGDAGGGVGHHNP